MVLAIKCFGFIFSSLVRALPERLLYFHPIFSLSAPWPGTKTPEQLWILFQKLVLP